MKIIKGPDPWTLRVTCTDTSCGTIIEITQEDVHEGQFGGSYCEEGTTEFYIECPTCGERLILEKLPTHVKRSVHNRIDEYGDK